MSDATEVGPVAAAPSLLDVAASTKDVLQQSRRGLPVGIVSRGIAFSVDLLVLMVLWSIGVFIVQAVASAFEIVLNVANVVQYVGAVLTVLVLIVIYHTVFTALFGRTPGKILMALRVVRLDGHPLNTGRSLVRTLAYALSAIFFLGFLWIAIDDRRQGWHDKIAKTVVLYDWEPRANRR